jgi:cytoskeletal protein CcmA (bactofilin family)
MTVVMRGELTLAEDLTIEGTLDGPCTAGAGTILVRRTARIHGAITAERLCIEDGTNLKNAVLTGRITCAKR